MSTHGDRHEGRRPRRQFTEEFKAGAVRLVLDEGKTVGAVARELDLTASALPQVGRAGAGRSDARARPGLTTAEREELARLRKENRDRCGGARHPKKSRGLLREAEPVRFRFIAAEKAEHTGHDSLSVSAGDAQRLLRLAAPSGIDACPRRSPAEGAGAGVVRREQAALRQPAHPRGSDRAARARQPQARRSG